MAVKKEFRQIRVECSDNQYYLSVLNPAHPIFRLHTTDTVVVLSSAFYETKKVCLLPENSLVTKLSLVQAEQLMVDWCRGKLIKSYDALPSDIKENVTNLLNIADNIILPSGV